DAVERYVASASGAQRFRQARGCQDASVDIAAYRGLEEVGVTSAFLPERLGGLGLASGVTALVADRLGWTLAREPFVENVVLPSILLQELRADDLVRRAQEGEIYCVAWQERKFSEPEPGTIRTTASREGDVIRVRGEKRFVMGARASTQI